MRYQVTRSHEIGRADHGWLQARHYFSFASYYNPERMGFGVLRVINDDTIAPSKGFSTHPHRDMEIITIPLTGAVKHEDSQGNKGLIHPGEVQVMSAGTGILHSEFNGSSQEALNLFQIWIEPNRLGVPPRYDQRDFSKQINKNVWVNLIAPMDDSQASGLRIHQQAYIHRADLDPGQKLTYSVKTPGHGLYLLVSEGEIRAGMEKLQRRDAMEVIEVDSIEVETVQESQVIVLEVPVKAG
jgi:quercetin 2,3-dioxygenase